MRWRRTHLSAIAILAAVGCGRSGVLGGGALPAPTGTPTPDATPQAGSLVFELVESPQVQAEIGSYDNAVTASLRNGGSAAAQDIRVQLTFAGPAGLRAQDFAAREIPWAATLDGGQSAVVSLRVDISPGVRFDLAEDVLISGNAIYHTGGTLEFVSPALTGDSWAFEPLDEANALVDTTIDAELDDGLTSLREAIDNALSGGERARIRFDPAVFPPGAPATITLLSELPPIDGADVILDGSDAGVILASSPTRQGSEDWMLRVRDDVVVHRITFLNAGDLYPIFDLTSDGCAGGQQEGGAILAEGNSTLTVDAAVFDDRAVARRNCFASTVRTTTGTGHRIRDSAFLAPAGDALRLQAETLEVLRNRIVDARDDGMIVEAGSGPTRVSGNLITDVTLAAVLIAGNAGDDPLEVTHNTFLRNQWSLRTFDARPVVIRNNASRADSNQAYEMAAGGQNATFSHLRIESGTFCSSCASATVDAATVVTGAGAVDIANPATGTDWPDIVPRAGSTLIDTATPLHDVNGVTAGLFEGAGPDIGAAERPTDWVDP